MLLQVSESGLKTWRSGDVEAHEESEDKQEAVSGATALHDPHSD
jgi:hypothetical protein